MPFGRNPDNERARRSEPEEKVSSELRELIDEIHRLDDDVELSSIRNITSHSRKKLSFRTPNRLSRAYHNLSPGEKNNFSHTLSALMNHRGEYRFNTCGSVRRAPDEAFHETDRIGEARLPYVRILFPAKVDRWKNLAKEANSWKK